MGESFMLKLYGQLTALNEGMLSRRLLSVTDDSALPPSDASTMALLTDEDKVPSGYGAVFRRQESAKAAQSTPTYLLPPSLAHVASGDIVRLDGDRNSIRILFRKESNHNAILLTERCNHYCLMCSQPPKEVDDSWLLSEAHELIKLMPPDVFELMYTGGEPTLYGDVFIGLLQHTKDVLPNTIIHILSNGRAFKDIAYARKYAAIRHPDMMLGIPLYSDDPVRHDYVVQAKGAFSETIAGILNLKSLHQQVEIRIVLHKQTIGRLVQLAEFIARNLLFVDHVALMGLEITGFTRANLDELWIDPYDYKDSLSEAVRVLEVAGLRVSVYNHQLCLVNRDVEHVCLKSISDWKAEYMDECRTCSKRSCCGGLFSSSKEHKFSAHIHAF